MRIAAVPLLSAVLLGKFVLGAPEPAAPRTSPLARDTAIVRVSGGAIDSALRSLAASRSFADIARDLPAGDLSQYQVVVLSRRVAGPAELHERWSDVVFVRSGGAILRTGPGLADPRAQGQGEYSGNTIMRARDQSVGAGDIVVIPAGLAHQWRPIGDHAFAYVVLKLLPGSTLGRSAHAP